MRIHVVLAWEREDVVVAGAFESKARAESFSRSVTVPYCAGIAEVDLMRESDFAPASDVVPDGFCVDCGCAPGQHPNSTCDEFAGTAPD